MIDPAALREPPLHSLHVFRIAQLEVGVADALASREQIVGELLWLQMHVPVDVLEPLHAIARRALELERLDLALLLIARERAADVAAMAEQHARERERVLHRELGPGADAEVRRMCGVADQDDVLVVPTLAQHVLEHHPRIGALQMPRIGHECAALEPVLEHLLAHRDRLRQLHLVHPRATPRPLGHLHDHRRPILVEAIRVEIEPPPLGLLEVEGERVELGGAAEPDEAITAALDVRLEHRLVLLARDRRHAIRRDHEVVVGGVVVGVGHLGLEAQMHAELRRPPLQNLQQRDARDSAEAMAARGDRAPLEVHIDIVPVTERIRDRRVRLRVGIPETGHRLVGEDDAPAEGVVRAVTLDHGDIAGWVGLLRDDREVEARGSAAEAHDLHATSLSACSSFSLVSSAIAASRSRLSSAAAFGRPRRRGSAPMTAAKFRLPR